MAVKKWMQGRLQSLGRMDTMLPVVRKPPEFMQMPLGLSLRMDIITSAVTEPEVKDREEEVRDRMSVKEVIHTAHERTIGTIMLLEKLCASLVALFGELHPGRRVLRAECLREVELSFTIPPALSLGHTPQLRVLCGDLCTDGELVGDVFHTL